MFGLLKLIGLTTINSSNQLTKIAVESALNNKAALVDNKTTQTGELVHGLGNSIVEGKSNVGSLTLDDGKILQELGHALRIRLIPDSRNNEFGECIKNGFNPHDSSHEFILEVLSRFVGNEGLLTFKQSVSCEMNNPIYINSQT